MIFNVTAINVLIMIVYAIPGFVLIKCKVIKKDSIAAFSVLLLYVCNPFLTIYSFQKIAYSRQVLINMGIILGLSLSVQLLFLFVMYLMYHKDYDTNIKSRVSIAAIAFGNIGFLGVPLLEAMIPEYPEAVAYSAVFMIGMNLLAWTLGSRFLTNDKKHMSIKNFLINPLMLGVVVALPLFFTNTKIPLVAMNSVEILAKMTAPLCMFILGMRFATVRGKDLFFDGKLYITTFAKLVAYPLAIFLLVYFLPIDKGIKLAMFILGCCPTATVVQNLAEIHSSGQKESANSVLITTIFSIITIPVLSLMLALM